MAKKIVKKSSKKTVKKPSSKSGKAVKKTIASKKGKKTVAPKKAKKTIAPKKKSKLPLKKGAKQVLKTKKVISEKDRQIREANAIANSEKKLANRSGGKSPKPAIGKGKRVKNNVTSEETSTLLDAIVNGMEEKKARNITILNLSDLENRVADFFVICDAESRTQVEAIAESVKDTVETKVNEKPYHAEGFENAEWILIDYINIVAHVFQKETRDYYNVEGLWADADIQTINN